MALIVTTAPPSCWPPQAQPLGPADAAPYLLRVADGLADDFLGFCARTGHRAEVAVNVYEAGLILREMLGRP